MLGNESFHKKNKELKNLNVVKLNLSSIKSPKIKSSISPRKKRRSNNSKYLSETLTKKNKREIEHEYNAKTNLDISKIKSPCSRLSISPRQKRISRPFKCKKINRKTYKFKLFS